MSELADRDPIASDHSAATDSPAPTLRAVLNLALDHIAAIEASFATTGKAVSDLADARRLLNEAAAEITEQLEDIVCPECGAYNNDGEGFDGLCGCCADQREKLDFSDRTPNDADEHEVDPVDPSLAYGAFLDGNDRYRGVIFKSDIASAATTKTYEYASEALSAAARLHAGNEDSFADAHLNEDDAEYQGFSYGTVYLDETDRFQGAFLIGGDIHATTPDYFLTPAGARLAARELATRA